MKIRPENEREMKSVWGWGALMLAFAFCTAARGQTLPDGRGRGEFERICTTCHTASMSTRVGKTQDEWKAVVADMASRGAQGTPAEMNDVVLYLSTNFGPGKGAPASQPAKAATAVVAPTPAALLNATDTEHAKSILAQNGCAACHRIGDGGSYLAPALDGVGSRKTAAEIRAAIVSPSPKVDPSNRQVRLVTANGQTISGRILNQDGYSVQMLNAAGQLGSYSKEGVKEFTIVDANPMPAFAGKISGPDLDVLVRYLSSLAEPGR